MRRKVKMDKFKLSYVGARDDVLSFVPYTSKRVLDVGCSVGTLGESIKRRIGAEVVGIELDEKMAKIAKLKLDKVIIGDVEELAFENHFTSKYFDCIIFADVLEHLKDPWKVLEESTKFLSEDGVVIASIPNVRHLDTIFNLVLKGYFPYRERGIHDKTHLRFFTLKNIKELFLSSNLKIVRIERKYRIIEGPHKLGFIINIIFSKPFALFFLKDFLTFQYLVVAKK